MNEDFSFKIGVRAIARCSSEAGHRTLIPGLFCATCLAQGAWILGPALVPLRRMFGRRSHTTGQRSRMVLAARSQPTHPPLAAVHRTIQPALLVRQRQFAPVVVASTRRPRRAWLNR